MNDPKLQQEMADDFEKYLEPSMSKEQTEAWKRDREKKVEQEYKRIQHYNKQKIQQHAKILLEKEQKYPNPTILYLTQAATDMLDDKKWQEILTLKATETLESLFLLSSRTQLFRIFQTQIFGVKQMLQTKTLSELQEMLFENLMYDAD